MYANRWVCLTAERLNRRAFWCARGFGWVGGVALL